MTFVGGADEDEGCENDVQHRIFRQKDEDAVSVGGQPNMVLGYKELQRDFAEPSEERRVTSPEPA